MSLASGPISLGKGGSFFNILLWCARKIRSEVMRTGKNTADGFGGILTWRCPCASCCLRPRWRAIRRSEAHTSKHPGSTSPLPGTHKTAINRLKETQHVSKIIQQKWPCHAPTLHLRQFLEPYIQSCHTQKRPFPPVSDKILRINPWTRCGRYLGPIRNRDHLVKLFTQAKVCQNYVTAWIQENIFQFQVPIDNPELQMKR